MKRPDTILFAVYGYRVGILTRDQLLAILATLRHGRDIDLGISLARRGILDERQAAALWNLVDVQSDIHGGPKKALGTIEAGALIQQAVAAALGPRPGPSQASKDPPTIRLD
ncbi:MAG: hypothetical protein IT452_20590 [Planctomycetia bacterium]|nr:hypothetical protein [Planctomycetia bacterium]